MSGALIPMVVEATTRSFGPCRKCSGVAIDVSYHDGEPHCRECAQLTAESCKYNAACTDTKGEHLVVRCERCRFPWIEPVG